MIFATPFATPFKTAHLWTNPETHFRTLAIGVRECSTECSTVAGDPHSEQKANLAGAGLLTFPGAFFFSDPPVLYRARYTPKTSPHPAR